MKYQIYVKLYYDLCTHHYTRQHIPVASTSKGCLLL